MKINLFKILNKRKIVQTLKLVETVLVGGDAYFESKEFDKAKSSYRSALTELENLKSSKVMEDENIRKQLYKVASGLNARFGHLSKVGVKGYVTPQGELVLSNNYFDEELTQIKHLREAFQ